MLVLPTGPHGMRIDYLMHLFALGKDFMGLHLSIWVKISRNNGDFGMGTMSFCLVINVHFDIDFPVNRIYKNKH